MRKILILIIFAFLYKSGFAQCTELFFSEYVEGNYNNKALEIYNPSNKAVDLSKYRITRWQNGSAAWTAQYSDSLKGSLCANCVIVCVIDRRNPAGTGTDTQVFSSLATKANLWLSKDYNLHFSMSFNGDDAMSLDKWNATAGDYVPVDIFGKIGERPQLSGNTRTIGWSDSFPHNNGLGTWYTIDKTLIRKKSVIKGISQNPAFFNPKTEWLLYPINTFDSLGSHRCDCNAFPANTAGLTINNPVVYPVPAANLLNVYMTTQIQGIQLLDFSGKVLPIDVIWNSNKFSAEINTRYLLSGTYILAVRSKDQIIYKQFIKQ